MPSSSTSSVHGGPQMPQSYRNHQPASYWEIIENHVCARCTPGHPDLRRRQMVRQFDQLRGPFLDYAVFLMEVRGWNLTDAVETAIMRQRSVRRQDREEERALRVRLGRPRTPLMPLGPAVVRDLPTIQNADALRDGLDALLGADWASRL